MLIVLAVLAGSFAAPMITLRSRLAEAAMPPGTGTETFTWLLLAVMVGVSASSALAGPLVELGGWRLGVLLAIAVAGRRAARALRRPPPPARRRRPNPDSEPSRKGDRMDKTASRRRPGD